METAPYNEHVIFEFDMGEMLRDPLVRGLDIFIGVLLALCALIGVPGNILALRYFTTARGNSLPTLLYITIASVDICTGNRGRAVIKLYCFQKD